jgi:hypothetical protein
MKIIYTKFNLENSKNVYYLIHRTVPKIFKDSFFKHSKNAYSK